MGLSMKYLSVFEETDVVDSEKFRPFVVCTWDF